MAGSLREFDAVETRTSNRGSREVPMQEHMAQTGTKPQRSRPTRAGPADMRIVSLSNRTTLRPALPTRPHARCNPPRCGERRRPPRLRSFAAPIRNRFSPAREDGLGPVTPPILRSDALTWVSKTLLNRLSPGDDWAGSTVPAENAGSLGLS